jgi:Tfp pilus assembly protein PilF
MSVYPSTAVSPDGCWVATGSHWPGTGSGAKVWDAQTGRLVHEFPVREFCQVQFSPDGRWLLTSNPARLWRVGTWEEGPAIGGTKNMCFAPDGKLLAVEGESRAIRLVEADSGRQIARLESPVRSRLIPCCFSPDGTRLVTMGQDTRQLHIWDLRALRQELSLLDLDWDTSPYLPETPAPGEGPAAAVVSHAEIVLGAFGQRVAADQLVAEANALDTAGKHTEALRAIRKAVRTDPTHAMAHNSLAWLLLSGPPASRDAREALRLARQAVKLAPEQGLYLNTLGVALYRVGQFAEAVPVLEASLEKSKGASDAFDLFFLAMAHARLGHPDKARACQDRALGWIQERRSGLPENWVQELSQFQEEAAEVLRELGDGKKER